ncbi:hypothetical protein ERJ75_000911600 [Trypanosoma vivax]|nr:hypothetical protein ERJ75_000911600 [Trypanosoma vivax]
MESGKGEAARLLRGAGTAKMCYGIASLWFDASLSDRERLERVRAQAARAAAGIPKNANREDALREARLKPINEAVRRRALEYYI